MTIQFFAQDGFVKDVGPTMPTYPADMVFEGPDGIQVGWTWDGKTAAPPAPLVVTVADLLAYANAKQDEILLQVWTFDVGTASAPMKLTTKLDATGQASMTKLMLWSIVNASQANAIEPYSNVDMTAFNLTPTQGLSMAQQSGAVFSASIATLNTVVSAIRAAPPTITTTAQIDAASWPAPSS